MFILNQILFNSVKQNHKKNMSGIILKSYFELVQSLKKKKTKIQIFDKLCIEFLLTEKLSQIHCVEEYVFFIFLFNFFFFLGFRQKLLFKSFGKIVTIVALSKYIIN